MLKINNVYERAIGFLASQYHTPNTQGVVLALCGETSPAFAQYQGIQNLLYAQMQSRWLSNAVGVQLDGIGDIVGIKRIEGQSDASYRIPLQAQVVINNSSGTTYNIAQIAQALSTPLEGNTSPPKISITEYYPQMLYVVIDSAFTSIVSNASALIQNACAAPVAIELVATDGLPFPLSLSGYTYSAQLYLNGQPLALNTVNSLQVAFIEDQYGEDGLNYGTISSNCN